MQPNDAPTSHQRDNCVAHHLAMEDHGRAVTTSRRAAAWYRQAQRALDPVQADKALRCAMEADPTFELAVTDLAALTGTAGHRTGRQQRTWERHHMEIVRMAVIGDATRATDLLREHLADVGCDPLALRITAQLRPPGWSGDDLQDPALASPGCHLNLWA